MGLKKAVGTVKYLFGECVNIFIMFIQVFTKYDIATFT